MPLKNTEFGQWEIIQDDPYIRAKNQKSGEIVTLHRDGTVESPAVSTERANIGDGPTVTSVGGKAKILVTSDWHWNDKGGRSASDIVGLPDLKSNLDTIVDDANNTHQPDHVFVAGDIADYNLSSGESELVEWLADAKDYFENSAGSDGNGIQAPVTYLLGDHEYGYAGTGDMQNVFDVFGWADESESWGATTTSGVKFLHLNTGKDDSPADGTVHAKRIPTEEQSFVNSELAAAEDTGIPAVVVSHVPLTGGPLEEESKDQVVNGDATLRDANGYSSFAAAFGGHIHHDNQFDRVRPMVDPYGTTHFINPTPNVFMEDLTEVPFTRATLMGDGSLAVDSPITNTSGYDVQWRDAGLNTTRSSPAQQAFRDHSLHLDYTVIDSLAAWANPSADGNSQIDAASGAVELTTGATSGNTEAIARRKQPAPASSGSSPQTHGITFDAPVAVRAGVEIVSSPSSFEVNILIGGGPTDKHVGITNIDGNLYLDTHDGSSRNQKQMDSSGFFTGDSSFSGMVASWPSGIAEYWEMKPLFDSIGSFNDGNTTSNVPSGDRVDDDLVYIGATTNASSDLTVRVHELEAFFGYIDEPLVVQAQSTESR